jgi:phage tail-like protein
MNHSDLQKFYPLGGESGWPTAQIAGVAAGRSGLRLEALPGGALSLASKDGSLGGLALPQGMALDPNGTLYLLDSQRQRVRRFEAQAEAEKSGFVDLGWIGGKGEDARQFTGAANLAISGGNLYVVDPVARRVQVFAIHTAWPLRFVWDAGEPSTRPPAGETDAWEPVDLAAQGSAVYILDRRYGRVFCHLPGMTALEQVLPGQGQSQPDEPAARRWKRILIDRQGWMYLLDENGLQLDVFDQHGRRVERVTDSGEVRDRFDPVAIRLLSPLSGGEYFCLPSSLIRLCSRQEPKRAPAPEMPLEACLASQAETGGIIFDRQGRPAQIDPSEAVGPPSYLSKGIWCSQAMDSGIPRCMWHRVEIEWGQDNLPAGAQVIVSTYTAEQDSDQPAENSPLWAPGFTFTGQPQPPPNFKAASAENSGPAGDGRDFLVHSREGRYLWLKIELRGDGHATPVVRAGRAHFPRQSYLSYLPAVYAGDDNSRLFLERFLSIFQTEWDDLERRLAEFHAHFDPQAMPAGLFVDELARWLALSLEKSWSFEQKRRLLQAVPRFYRQRGTLAGLRAFLQAYLYNLTDIPPEQQQGFPQIAEGFRLRQRHILDSAAGAQTGLGSLSPLWGPAVVGRLQLDAYAREGQARLVSTGNPQNDLFNYYAHRFLVYIPASWVQTKDNEAMLRRALEVEKPAQAVYELCLVEPRFRVGVQATIGQDTLIGSIPRARLWRSDPQRPASAQPSSRLGYDTVLSGGEPQLVRLGRNERMSKTTILW